MIEIGIFDLKTHLSEMIARVQKGEEFLITNRGQPVALLTSPEEIQQKKEKAFFSQLNSLLKAAPLAHSTEDLRKMIEEGRR